MDIVKQSTGNVVLKDNSGNIIKVFVNVNALDVVSSNEIIVKFGFNQWYSIFADQIKTTQIEPSGSINFSGNAYDLITLLSSSFFFELTISQKSSFIVNGGTIGGTQPTFSGAPLFSGQYVKIGSVVHFEIQVDFDNITNFGTGQYFVELPFESCCAYQLRDGCIHDISTGRQYSISGHLDANSKVLSLNYIGSSGRDEPFTHNQPFVLNIADNFHIAGTYLTY
jgi:hypothetical protein